MKQPYIVLGVYHPSKWNTWAIGKDLTTLTRKAGLVPHNDPAHGPIRWKNWYWSEKLHAEVRRKTTSAMQAEDWHQDGDTTPGSNMNCYMVLWSSAKPTELRYNGAIYQPKPFEVILIDNRAVYHRRPPNCPQDRWTFRQRVAVPKNLKLKL